MNAKLKGKKILIVEDEKLLSEMYRDSFAGAGFEVIIATTGQEAVDTAKAEKPDFILLDILLPSEDGLYFLRQKKKTPEISSIPVLVFSAYDHAETKKEASRLGAYDYLIKTDYTPQEIVKKIEKYLQ